MSLNQRETGQISRALSVLEGSVVQKIQLSAPLRLSIELRQPGQSFRLFVCGEAGATRLHLAEDREAGSSTPPAFQGLMRARLMGARLARLEQLPGERVVALTFQTSRGAEHRLIAELTGRRGNFFLLDEAGKILGSAIAPSPARREARAGAPYRPPPQGERIGGRDPIEASRFEGLPDDAVLLSRKIAACYREIEERARIEAARSCRLRPLRAELKKVRRALDKARDDLERCRGAEAALWRGNLLKANLHLLAKGQRSVHLIDYTPRGPREVSIELDPSKTPQQEIEVAFRRYRRWLGGRDKAGARVGSLEARVREIEAALAAAEAMADADSAGEGVILDGSGGPPQGAPARGRSARERGAGGTPFREYESSAGQRIWVGRSARHNDELTFRCAKGNDVWLHVRSLPGSHVVIPLARGEDPREETLLDACQLARHFSSARDEAAEVSWTRVKFVRRQKGGAPGAVTYSQEKTALIRRDEARIARLLGGTRR